MFIPIYDGVALRYLRRPIANWSIIGLNVAVWLAASAGLFGNVERVDLALGAIPAVLFGEAQLGADLALVPAPWTLVTGMFLHGGFLHLAGNMLFLWVFGDNVEDAMGSLRYVAFYLLCGIAGALLYSFVVPHSQAPLIGASAAISGVVAAYLMLYPWAGIFGLVFSIIPLRVPALVVVGVWILYQLFAALTGGDAAIGWWAHIGGLATGAILTPLFKRAEVHLWSARRA
jgi:membrane associated rhomboid family serine protease